MITLLYASILGLLSVLLANQVLYVRLRGGKEEKWRSNATERVQANFVENVPLALIILFIFEYSSSSNNMKIQNSPLQLPHLPLRTFRS